MLELKEPEWILCPACKDEVSLLGSSGFCLDCETKKEIEYSPDIPPFFYDCKKAFYEFTFEKFVLTKGTKEAYEAAKSFNPKTENLYLWGSCGIGKTHLIYSIARKLIDKMSVEIIKPPELVRQLRGKEGADEEQEIVAYSEIECLLIDDMGVGRATEYNATLLYEIIDRRYMGYRNGLVITSNLSLQDLGKKLNDDRLTSRLAGMCKIVKMSGDDWRLKNGKRSQI